MEKKVSRAWLFFMVALLIVAAVALWLCVGKTAKSYSGGILIDQQRGEVCSPVYLYAITSGDAA